MSLASRSQQARSLYILRLSPALPVLSLSVSSNPPSLHSARYGFQRLCVSLILFLCTNKLIVCCWLCFCAFSPCVALNESLFIRWVEMVSRWNNVWKERKDISLKVLKKNNTILLHSLWRSFNSFLPLSYSLGIRPQPRRNDSRDKRPDRAYLCVSKKWD